ncbi:MAG: hypothetical protein O7H41_11840 [Planctomycetota bacterium]|nr:hypothetical protein [Planctomycetota bacterium]
MHSLLLAVLLLSPPLANESGTGDSYKVDRNKVYYGNPDSFKKPATIDRDKVFAKISYYAQILKEGLTRKDARYWTLLKKANKVFSKALGKVATDGGYDLIAESGSIKAKGKKKKKAPPDITKAAIKAAKKIEEES